MADKSCHEERANLKPSSSVPPLKFLSGWLKLCGIFGGFPFAVSADGSRLQFSVLMKAFCFLGVLCIIIGVGFINGVYTFLLNLSLGRIFEGLQFHDFTFTDTVVFLGLLPLGLIGIGVHLKYFFGLKTVLPKLNQDLVVLSADLGISVQQIQSITRRNVGSTAILAGLIMASGLLCWGFEYLFIRSYFQTFISSLAFSGLLSVGVTSGLWSSSAIAFHLIAKQYLEVLSVLMRNYGNQLSGPMSNGDTYPIKKVKHDRKVHLSLDTGYRLQDTIQNYNDTFGGLLLFNLGFCLVMLVVSSFCTLNIYSGFIRSNWVLFLFGIENSLQGIHSFLRSHLWYKSGQRLKNASVKALEHLENLIVSNFDDLSEQTRFRGQILIRRFEKDAAIRPCNVMNMDLSTGLVSGGLIVTYLIVLFQFKLSEISDSNCMTTGKNISLH